MLHCKYRIYNISLKNYFIRSILDFKDKIAEKLHIKVVKWWNVKKIYTLLEQQEMTTNLKKKKASSTKMASSSKKPKFNYTIVPKSEPSNEDKRFAKKLKRLEEEGRHEELLNHKGKLDAFLAKAVAKTGGLKNANPNIVRVIAQLDQFMSSNEIIIREDLNDYILQSILDYYPIRFWKTVLPALFDLSDEYSIKLQSFDVKHTTSFAAFLVESIINETLV